MNLDAPPEIKNLALNNDEADFEPINEQSLLDLLERVEKENSHVVPQQNVSHSPKALPVNIPNQQQNPVNILVPVNQNQMQQTAPNMANFNATVSNVSNRNAQPVMYFPGSTVTINYNFYNQK